MIPDFSAKSQINCVRVKLKVYFVMWTQVIGKRGLVVIYT